MAKLELNADGQVVITDPDTERRSGIGSLLGGVAGAAKGVGENIATLLGRAGRAGRSGREEVEDKSSTFDVSQFIVDKFNEEGVQPKIIGESPDGQSFVIETPMGGSMIISLKDFIKNFGKPPMKFKGIERGADDQPYRFATGGRVNYAKGTMMASAPDPMDERNELSLKMFQKPIDLLTPEEMDMLNDEIERLMQKFSFKEKDNMQMASMDENEREFMRLVEEFMERGFNQQEAIEAAREEFEKKAMATGGRVLKQTGGITETRTLPPEFVEAAQRTFLTDLATQSGMPSVTTATAKQPGETDAQFAQRQAQAQQFGITKASMAELAPQVAAQDPLQAAAYAQAVDPTKGLGSFQPFLTDATTAAGAATALTGTGAGTGVGSIQSYMSPYQQQVIDTTMQDFDQQAQIRANQQAAAALGTPGAFGGGREGVQRAQYQAQSDQNRAQTLANLRQSGFQNAAARRQQDLANQMGISNLQSGLGARAQDFSRAQISGLGTLGAAQQAQNQAVLDAQRQAAQMAIEEPRQALSRFGQGIAGITPGAGSIRIGDAQAEAAGASPLMKALGLGLAGADIYGRIFT